MEAPALLGVDFISTTQYHPSVLQQANSHNIPVLCGVSSYEDAYNALLYGAEALKFYPSSAVSPAQLADILQRLHHTSSDLSTRLYYKKSILTTIPIVVAGGVTESMMSEYIAVGATNFCVGYDCSNISDFKDCFR